MFLAFNPNCGRQSCPTPPPPPPPPPYPPSSTSPCTLPRMRFVIFYAHAAARHSHCHRCRHGHLVLRVPNSLLSLRSRFQVSNPTPTLCTAPPLTTALSPPGHSLRATAAPTGTPALTMPRCCARTGASSSALRPVAADAHAAQAQLRRHHAGRPHGLHIARRGRRTRGLQLGAALPPKRDSIRSSSSSSSSSSRALGCCTAAVYPTASACRRCNNCSHSPASERKPKVQAGYARVEGQSLECVSSHVTSLADAKEGRPIETPQRVRWQLPHPFHPSLAAATALKQRHEEPAAEIFLRIHARALVGPRVASRPPAMPARQRRRQGPSVASGSR